MRRAVIIRHLAFEDLGSFADVLTQQGYAYRYLEAGVDPLSGFDPEAPDLLIVLGGPIGVYQESIYPFLTEELTLLRARLQADRPTLGICLGAQLMARALGGRVYPGSAGKEIGWSPLRLTAEGEAGPLRHLAPARCPAVLHWHGDTFDLPQGAVRLAGSDRYPNQAFAWGKAGLALQCHPEVTVAGMERWFIGHTGEIHATPGLSVPDLRDHTHRFGDALVRQGRAFLGEWLSQKIATTARRAP